MSKYISMLQDLKNSKHSRSFIGQDLIQIELASDSKEISQSERMFSKKLHRHWHSRRMVGLQQISDK